MLITQPIIFLAVLLVISLLAKNQSLIIAVIVLLAIKLLGLEAKILPFIQQKGINLGVIIITISVLVPIATGEIGIKHLFDAMKSYYAWIALISGIIVALLAKGGIHLLANDPHITTALVFGTIIAVTLFNGIAVGPLIGAGIAYFFMKIFTTFSQ